LREEIAAIVLETWFSLEDPQDFLGIAGLSLKILRFTARGGGLENWGSAWYMRLDRNANEDATHDGPPV
jgi:hypothetical protein